MESPEITFEGGLSGNNLSTILDNVNASAKTPANRHGSTNTHRPGQIRPKNLKWTIF